MDRVYRPGWAKNALRETMGNGFVTAGEVAQVEDLVSTLAAVTRSAEAARAPQSPFHALLDDVRALHDAKNKDYADNADPFKNFRGCEEWGLAADYGCFTRMGDKVMRLTNLVRREFLDGAGAAVAAESIEDTAIDLAVYSLIYVLLRRERTAKGAA